MLTIVDAGDIAVNEAIILLTMKYIFFKFINKILKRYSMLDTEKCA